MAQSKAYEYILRVTMDGAAQAEGDLNGMRNAAQGAEQAVDRLAKASDRAGKEARGASDKIRLASNNTDAWKGVAERTASLMGGTFGDISDSVFDLGERFGKAGAGMSGMAGAATLAAGGLTAVGFAAAFGWKATREWMEGIPELIASLREWQGIDPIGPEKGAALAEYAQTADQLTAVTAALQVEMGARLAPAMTQSTLAAMGLAESLRQVAAASEESGISLNYWGRTIAEASPISWLAVKAYDAMVAVGEDVAAQTVKMTDAQRGLNDTIRQTNDEAREMLVALGMIDEVEEVADDARQRGVEARQRAAEAAREEAEAVRKMADEQRKATASAMDAANARLTRSLTMSPDARASMMSDADTATQQAQDAGAWAAEAIANPVGAAVGDAMAGLGATLSPLTGAISAIAGMAQSIVQIPDTLRGITKAIGQLDEALMDIPQAAIELLEGLGELPQALIDALPQIVMGLAEFTFKAFTWGFEAFLDMLADLFDAIPGRIADAIANGIRAIVSELNPFDGDGNFLGTDLTAEKGERRLLGLKVPFFETGGEVAKTGLAYVHEGERVVSVAERMQGQRGGGPVVVNVHTSDPRVMVDTIRRATGLYGVGGGLGVR